MITNKSVRRVIKFFWEIYEVFTSLLLFIFFKPTLLIAKKSTPESTYKEICFFLIKISNLAFFPNKFYFRNVREQMYDLRNYRDNYDKGDINLFYKLSTSKILFSNKNVLDFGCGVGGKCLAILKEKPRKIIGLELSKRNIYYAKELLNDKNKKQLQYIDGNILKIPFKEKFDTIVSYTVFEHLPKNVIDKIIKKISRILNSGGKVVIIYDFYNDRYGSHHSYYIYSPWPQMIFDYSILCAFWNRELAKDKRQNVDSYFPKNYKLEENDKRDCYMELNRLQPDQFENIVENCGLKIESKYYYSKSTLLSLFPFLPKKYLLGSVAYLLTN